jgi:hypothetical protein
MSVDRWLLNTFSAWELGLILIGACAAVAFSGYFLARPFVHRIENRVASTAFGIITGIFSFVLAFLIGQLYSNFNTATSNVHTEATALSQLVRDSHYLGSPKGKTVQRLALAYASEVERHEWKLLREGTEDPKAWKYVNRMYSELAGYTPKTPAQGAFYGQAMSQLQDLVVARRTRLNEANVSVPGAFEVMLLLGAVLALLTTLNFKPAGDRLQLVMIGGASVLVGLALLVGLLLDFPFSGDVTVSKKPFTEITPAQLDR